MRVRISDDFKIAYKRLKKRHKSLQADFEGLLASLLKNPEQGVELIVVPVRYVLPLRRKDVERVEVHGS